MKEQNVNERGYEVAPRFETAPLVQPQFTFFRPEDWQVNLAKGALKNCRRLNANIYFHYLGAINAFLTSVEAGRGNTVTYPKEPTAYEPVLAMSTSNPDNFPTHSDLVDVRPIMDMTEEESRALLAQNYVPTYEDVGKLTITQAVQLGLVGELPQQV